MLRRYTKSSTWALSAMVTCLLTLSNVVVAQPTLGDLASGLDIDKEAISVSGISSGAFMAHQFHVAHSEHIIGAGIIAGGPYYCAKGSILDAVTRCSQFVALSCAKLLAMFGVNAENCGDRTPKTTSEIAQFAQDSFDEAKNQETSGNIGRLHNLKLDKIYLFSGRHDGIVPHGVMDTVFAFYADPDKGGLKPSNVEYNREFPARHTVVRDSFNKPPGKAVGDCVLPPDPAPPPEENSFIDDCYHVAQETMEKNSCICPPQAGSACPPTDKKELCEDVEDVDLAGAILQHIYGEEALTAERVAVQADEVQPFDQLSIFKKLSPRAPRTARISASMRTDGYIFIPESCQEGEECKLHVAFHGCLQGGETDKRPGHSGNLFSKYAGYNEWAKANSIVVLYPQVAARHTGPINPQGCWDWWGQDYTHENYHTKRGIQVRAVAQMINVLVGGPDDLLDISPQ